MCFRAIVVVMALFGAATANAASKTAVFPFELIDTSQEGEMQGVNADESRRLKMISDELVKLTKEQGQLYAPVDLSALRDEITAKAPLHKCNGCEADLAKKANADVAIVGTVQKVSNLILNLNLYVSDVGSGEVKRVMSTDIRGNTDETWMKGIRWLTKNRLFASESASQ